MEVSKRGSFDRDMESHLNLANDPSALQIETHQELAGEELIQALVALTGLPEGLANQEVDQILSLPANAPVNRSDLTLDELRTALIAYLEALQPTE